MSLSNILSQSNFTSTYSNDSTKFAVTKTINQVSNKITNLNSNYTQNTGLLINIVTYNNSPFSYYINYYTRYIAFIFQVLNLPVINSSLIISLSNTKTNYKLTKTIFNNTPVITQVYEAFAVLDPKSVDTLYSATVSINIVGNFPSMVFTLNTAQFDLIVRENLFTKQYQSQVPVIIKWGEATPSILYKKYIWDQTIAQDPNRTIPSYIINNGPSALDELSAYVEYIKLQYLLIDPSIVSLNNTTEQSLFRYYTPANYSFYNMNSARLGSFIGGPTGGSYLRSNKQDFILNFNSYSGEYIIDISNRYIIYLGIDTSYGWSDPLVLFSYLASNLITIELPSYDSSSGLDVEYRASAIGSGLSEISYNAWLANFVDLCQNIVDISDISDNVSNATNPTILMIKIPNYQTAYESNLNFIGNGVLDAWNVALYYIASLDFLDLSSVNIFLRSYSNNSDLISLRYLYNNPFLISRTCGSIYDFQQDNFVSLASALSIPYTDTSFINTFIGLQSIKPYNAFAYNGLNAYIAAYNSHSSIISAISNIQELLENFDQFKFYDMIANVVNMTLLINNVQFSKGIVVNAEDLALSYYIYTGQDIYANHANFDFTKLAESNGSNVNGYNGNSMLLFSDLISNCHNKGKYWSPSNGVPFNRNTSYVLMKRDLPDNLAPYHYWNLQYRNFYTGIDGGTSLFLSSQNDLVNAVIFKLNRADQLFNQSYSKFISMYQSDTLVYDFSNRAYYVFDMAFPNNTVPEYTFDLGYFLSNNNFTIQTFTISNLLDIKKIVIGNNVLKIQDFSGAINLEEIQIGERVGILADYCFKSCRNLAEISFHPSSKLTNINSYAFANCTSLQSIQLPGTLKFMHSRCFSGCSSLTSIDLSNTFITVLDSEIFYDCSSLVSIIFPHLITKIDSGCFQNCHSLNHVVLPNNLNTLTDNVFNNCSHLINITFNSELSNIGSACFLNCTNLILANLENTHILDLSDSLFYNCTSLKDVILPYTLMTIQDNVFTNCVNLRTIIVLSSLSSISQNNHFQNAYPISIYYFSSFSNFNLSVLQTLNVNNTDLSFIDFCVHPPEPSFSFKYVDYSLSTWERINPTYYFDTNTVFNVALNNYLVHSEYDISFIIPITNANNANHYYLELSSNFVIESNLDILHIGTYDISYIITIPRLNDISFVYVRHVNVVDPGGLSFPTLTIYGNDAMFKYIGTTDFINIDYYGSSCLPEDPVTFYFDLREVGNDLSAGTFNLYYYIFDLSLNYISVTKPITIFDYSNAYNVLYQLNLKVNYNKCNYNNNNNTLALQFENWSNVSETGEFVNGVSSSVFPIFMVSTISAEAVDLTNVNGPPLTYDFNSNNTPVPVSFIADQTNYYFVQRLDSNVFNNSDISLIFDSTNFQDFTVSKWSVSDSYEQYYVYSPPMMQNGWIGITIHFGVPLESGKTYAVFLDNGTAYQNGLFNYLGNSYEGYFDSFGKIYADITGNPINVSGSQIPYIFDTFGINSKNVFVFTA